MAPALRICEFNVENLFVSMEYYEGQDLDEIDEPEWKAIALPQLRPKQKPLAKLWGLSRAVLDINADIFMLAEIGGGDSLENFNRHFLGDRYTAYFVEGNSTRGIDLGFLVKKSLRFRAEAESNRDLPVEVHGLRGKYLSRFSRDVAQLNLYDNSGLRLILLLAHLKSKLSTEQDLLGKDTRTAEAIALAGLYARLRSVHPETPVIVAGDFNSALSSLELELIARTDLVDFHDVLGSPPEARSTHVHIDLAGNAHPSALDYILISPHLRDRVVREGSCTYRYRGFYDLPEALPTTLRERYQMPSDHYPLVLEIELDE